MRLHGCCFFLLPVKRVSVLTVETQLNTVNVEGQYLVPSDFVWGPYLLSVLPTIVTFILPGWIVSPDNAQNAKSHLPAAAAFILLVDQQSMWPGRLRCVCILCSIFGCSVAIFSQILIYVEMSILEVDLF
jgi:hypothetical protein